MSDDLPGYVIGFFIVPTALLIGACFVGRRILRAALVVATIVWIWAALGLVGTLSPMPGMSPLRPFDFAIAMTGLPLYMLTFCVCAAKTLREVRKAHPQRGFVLWAILLMLSQVTPFARPSLMVLALGVVLLFTASNVRRLGQVTVPTTHTAENQ